MMTAQEEVSKIEAELEEAQHDLRESLTEASAKAEHQEGMPRPDRLVESYPIEATCVAGALGFVIGSMLHRSPVGPAIFVSLLGFAISRRFSNDGSADYGRAKAFNR
jgi:F0F1-type ATP synthase assembly protein I